MPAIEYRLALPEPHTHLYHVEIHLPDAATRVELVMPSWTPGSYLLREFPRNVQDFEAHGPDGSALDFRKADKNRWVVEAGDAGEMRVRYRVYANELTVRTSHLDASHGYVNGASVFMYVAGRAEEALSLTVDAPAGWRTETALREDGSGGFRASGYDELVDCPLEIGIHRTFAWEQHGVPHRFAVWGADALDEARWIADTRRIIDSCAELFGGLPYDRYLFIVHVLPDGRGGLEHATSTSLHVSPAWMEGDGYESFIALVAHEFFHVWLGKRIRPAPLGPFDYTAENYTRNLWVVEGFTTYYTDLILRRAGLMTPRRYLDRLSDSIARLRALPGRRHQSLEDASFDAWIKFYRPDSHTPNSQVSYYQKGALVALALDLEIRRASDGERSLDDVMRLLWQRYGARDVGFPEDTAEGIQAVVEEVYGGSLGKLFDAYVSGTEEIDFEGHLAVVGLTVEAKGGGGAEGDAAAGGGDEGGEGARRSQRTKGPLDPLDLPGRLTTPPPHESRLGVRLRDGSLRPQVTHVLEGSPAYEAGVNAGDEIIGVGGVRATRAGLAASVRGLPPGSRVALVVARRERLLPVEVTLHREPGPPARVVRLTGARPEAVALRRDWLQLQPDAPASD